MSIDENVEKLELSLLMGLGNDAATLESSSEVSQKVKNRVTT